MQKGKITQGKGNAENKNFFFFWIGNYRWRDVIKKFPSSNMWAPRSLRKNQNKKFRVQTWLSITKSMIDHRTWWLVTGEKCTADQKPEAHALKQWSITLWSIKRLVWSVTKLGDQSPAADLKIFTFQGHGFLTVTRVFRVRSSHLYK